MREDESAKFYQILLIGCLGDGENNGSGEVKKKLGMGEVLEDALGKIEQLVFQDVLLK